MKYSTSLYDHHTSNSDSSTGTDIGTRDSMSSSILSDTSTISSVDGMTKYIKPPPLPFCPSILTPSYTGNGTNVVLSPTSNPGTPFVRSQFSPILLKSVSAPVLPSFKPQDQRLPKPKGCFMIAAEELSQILYDVKADDLLIFDVRPFIEYSKSSIKSSIHVCLPSTLLRRKSFTFSKLIDNLNAEEQLMIKEEKLKNQNLRIIIYDNIPNQTEDAVSLACSGIASKVLDHYSTTSSTSSSESIPFHSVSILSSGFSQIQNLYPDHLVWHEDEIVSQAKIPLDLKVRVPVLTKSTLQSRSLSTDSPISSSSPISALSKFKLPAAGSMPGQMFKIAQNEEIMNIESYLSAVNIKEEHEQSSMHTFQFPKPVGMRRKDSNKLKFQVQYEDLKNNHNCSNVDMVIPKWFQKLMARSKIDFISQFQKLDFLERKRLNKVLTHKTSYSAYYESAKGSPSIDSKAFPPCNKNVQKRSYSQPSCINVNKKDLKLLCDVQSDDEDDDDITISLGIELGIKNRYKDIFPYEHSRVILNKRLLSSISHSDSHTTSTLEDYINANYLNVPHFTLPVSTDGQVTHSNPRNVRYIATQAPLASTVHDFYTCILNDSVPLVLTLTDSYENGVEKCFPYWDEGNYNGIQVNVLEKTCVSTPSMSNDKTSIFLRRLQLTYDDGKTFETLQLHIKDWPDLGTLIDPTQIIQAINLKNVVINGLFNNHVYADDYTPTILVHCSAGCGRTGTWCTVDSIISNLEVFDILQHECSVDPSSSRDKLYDPIVWTINTFRKQRISIVQNVNQFLFIYDCLLYYFNLLLNDGTETKDKQQIEGCSMDRLLNQIKDLEIVQRIIDAKIHEPLPIF